MPSKQQDNIILDNSGDTPAINPAPNPIPAPVPVKPEYIEDAKTSEPIIITNPPVASVPVPPTPVVAPEPIKVPEPTPVEPKPVEPKPVVPEPAPAPAPVAKVEPVQMPPMPAPQPAPTPVVEPRKKGPLVSANPDVDGYLYNKSTIDGIDQSKLEYKETFKNRIYISKPNHRYSWIILAVLVVIGIFGSLYYYINTSGTPAETPLITEEPTTTPPVIEEQPVIDVKTELLKITTPNTVAEDTVLNTIKGSVTTSSNTGLNLLLNKDLLDRISVEFKSVQTIVEQSTVAQ